MLILTRRVCVGRHWPPGQDRNRRTAGSSCASKGGLSADSRGVTACLAINSQPIESGFIA
jgi:hypothetical protein